MFGGCAGAAAEAGRVRVRGTAAIAMFAAACIASSCGKVTTTGASGTGDDGGASDAGGQPGARDAAHDAGAPPPPDGRAEKDSETPDGPASKSDASAPDASEEPDASHDGGGASVDGPGDSAADGDAEGDADSGPQPPTSIWVALPDSGLSAPEGALRSPAAPTTSSTIQ